MEGKKPKNILFKGIWKLSETMSFYALMSLAPKNIVLTQQPPLRAILLKITLPSRCRYPQDTIGYEYFGA